MNIIEIESKRLELLNNFNNKTSGRQKLLLLTEFFDVLLLSNDQSIIHSYLLEFSDDFAQALREWNVFYLPPQETERIIKLSKTVKNHPALRPLKEKLVLIISKLENNLLELKGILNGLNVSGLINDSKIYFPIVEDNGIGNSEPMYSYLESITVKISKASSQNRFIIVPSMKVIEDKLNNQIRISWERAVEILKKHRHRLNQFHDVIINFDQRLGEYVGNSLGIALTLAFLQELFVFYNTSIILKVPANLAFTGGIEENAKIVPICNRKYIKSKMQCVFFSAVNSIILHKNDEEVAKNELKKLQDKYPERKLRVIGVEEIDDLLNRRDIIDIKKQNPILRTSKFIRKQKVAVIILIVSLLGLLYANLDLDNNPVYFKNYSNIVQVLNKNGKVLWEKKSIHFKKDDPSKDYLSSIERVIDIDGDGVNEVIFSQSILGGPNPNKDMGWVTCFNNKGNLLWKYQFTKKVKTHKDIHTTTYVNYIIGCDTENGKKIIYLYANNQPLYPSVIYKISALTGKRLPGIFWHAGHIVSALLGNFDGEGMEIVSLAISNCYERCVLFSIMADSLQGQGPANKNYTFFNINPAHLIKYILLPKSDLTNFDKLRFNTSYTGNLSFHKEDNNFDFYLIEGDIYRGDAISYLVNDTLTDFEINVGDQFQVDRDSLVSKGLLQKPYSNTIEYTNILKKQIEYWNGGKFKDMY